MQEILLQLETLFLSAIPTILLFIVLVLAYQFLIQGPLTKTLKERRARTEGAIEDAQKAMAEAEARAAEYAAKLRRHAPRSYKMRERASSSGRPNATPPWSGPQSCRAEGEPGQGRARCRGRAARARLRPLPGFGLSGRARRAARGRRGFPLRRFHLAVRALPHHLSGFACWRCCFARAGRFAARWRRSRPPLRRAGSRLIRCPSRQAGGSRHRRRAEQRLPARGPGGQVDGEDLPSERRTPRHLF